MDSPEVSELTAAEADVVPADGVVRLHLHEPLEVLCPRLEVLQPVQHRAPLVPDVGAREPESGRRGGRRRGSDGCLVPTQSVTTADEYNIFSSLGTAKRPEAQSRLNENGMRKGLRSVTLERSSVTERYIMLQHSRMRRTISLPQVTIHVTTRSSTLALPLS